MQSLDRVATRFQQLAQSVQGVAPFDEVAFGQEGEISVTRREGISLLLLRLKYQLMRFVIYLGVSPHLSSRKAYMPEGNQSLAFLSYIFGKERTCRIIQRAELSLDGPLTKLSLEWIVVKACEVYEEDLCELLQEIQSDSAKIRYLTQEESAALRQQFQNSLTLDQCTNSQIHLLFSLLIPIQSISHLFFHKVPEPKPFCIDSGKGLKGLRERVFCYESLRRNAPPSTLWIMRVIKRLVDREIPAGVVFPSLHGGFCKVHAVVFGKGAFKCFLKQIGCEGANQQNIVLYRGTRTFPSATQGLHTMIEDLRFELGSKGPQATYEATRGYLTDPARGFIRHPQERVVGIGMSLGATHMKRDALLFKDAFSCIYPVAGPGLDEESVQLYANYINSRKDGSKPRICYFWEADDVTHHLGRADLGYGCDPAKIEIEINLLDPHDETGAERPLEEVLKSLAQKVQFPKRRFTIQSLLEGLFGLKASLRGPHCRITIDAAHRVIRLTNQLHKELVDRILGHREFCDTSWEDMRQLAVFDKYSFTKTIPFSLVVSNL